MRIIPFSPSALQEALEVLAFGGVVAHATETCYGLACDLRNAAAVQKLFAIKQRPHTQPVSGLFMSVKAAKEYVEWNARADELSSYLPGPLTLILPLKPEVRLFPMPGGGSTLGVRVSSHPHAMALVKKTRFPLSTTSANVHGKPNPYSAHDIEAQFEKELVQPDLVIDGGTLPPVPPSTVTDLTNDGKTLRSGDVTV